MTRTQWTLAVLLVVQLILILFVRAPFSGATRGAETHSLLPGLEAVTAARVELVGGDATLALLRDGDGWTLEGSGFPADGGAVDGLLDNLRSLTVRRPVASTSRYHDSFKVAENENEGRVRVWDDPSGEPGVDLILGTSPNYQITHVRRADEDRVYEVRGLGVYDVRAEPGSWIDKTLVEVAADRLLSLELTNAEGSFRLDKGENGWTVAAPAGDLQLDQDKVDTLVRAATSLRLAEPVGPVDPEVHGFDEPSATLVLRYSAGTAEDEAAPVEEITVSVGRKLDDPETQRYVTRSGFPFTGTIWDSSVTSLTEKKLGDLSAS